jgi:hypothetical protein
MKIEIKDPKLAEDLRALASTSGEPTVDAFVSRMLKIAIRAAVEAGRRKERGDKPSDD